MWGFGKCLMGFGLLGIMMSYVSCKTWQPIYQTKKVQASYALSQIALPQPKNRTEQMILQELAFMFSTSTKPLYQLSLSVKPITQKIGIGEDDVASRIYLILIMHYQLHTKKEGQRLTSGSLRASASYDIPNSDYANKQAFTNATTKSAKRLAQDLSTRLMVFLKQTKKPPLETKKPHPRIKNPLLHQ